MVELRFKQQTKLKVRLGYNIKIAQTMALDQSEYTSLKIEVENHPLFKKLVSSSDTDKKIISRRRFPNTDLSSRCLELNDRIIAGNNPFNTKHFVGEQQDTIPLIEKIGMENFKRYFLYNESNIDDNEIAGRCDLELSQVKKINEFINDFVIESEFSETSGIDDFQTPYHAIAVVERNDSLENEFVINYFSPNSAKGEYVVDYEKLKELKGKDSFDKTEHKQIDELINKIKLINSRESMIYMIITKLIELHKEYLISGDEQKMYPLTQKELANIIGGHPSTINRAIAGRSIVTPWGEEKPLKRFLSGKKHNIKGLIKEIILEEQQALSDEKIKSILLMRYDISISRRSIAKYRNELNIKSSFKRKSE